MVIIAMKVCGISFSPSNNHAKTGTKTGADRAIG